MLLEKKTWALDKDQVFFYKEMGYLVVPQVFSHGECDAILSRMRTFANTDFAPIMNPDRPGYLLAQYTRCKFGIKPTDESPVIGPIVDNIERVLQDHSDLYRRSEALGLTRAELDKVYETTVFLRSVMRDPRQKDILETLQGREVVALMSQTIFKEAGTRFAKQAWRPHQDNSYPKNPNAQYITTNLFLANADKENGTLYMYPGSHKLGLLGSEETQSFREAKGDNPGNRTLMPAVWEDAHYDVNFKKGDLLVLNGNCIHGSYANDSNRARPLYSQSLISKGEPFVPGPNARRMEISLR